MGRLPASWLQELLDRTNLRDLVGRYVPLQQKGQRLWGKCPFHHDNDPSFSVSEEHGSYHCFGCGKHGNAIDFVMAMEHLEFREACSYLAEQAGLDLPEEESPQEKKNRDFAARIKTLNREAASFYHRVLCSAAGKKGAQYLEERGIDRKLCTRYGLGYAPDDWHLLRNHLKKKGFTDKEAEASGLVHCKNGNRYDAFRDRVIFPIIDPRSEVIGFGGRILGDGQPKYLNSPATPVFNKSRSLFNLNTVKQLKNRGELKRLVLMEGYMDVIGAARFGIYETCATLGTALTPEQCALIKRYSSSVLICYDGDGAGVKAANRAIGLLRDAGVEARVIYLPGNMDPDEFLKTEGRDAFDQRANEAMPPLDFRFAVAAKDFDLHKTEEKAEYVNRCIEILHEEKDPVVQEAYAQKLAKQTNFRVESILQSVSGSVPAAAPARQTAPKANRADVRAENFIAALMLSRPEAAQDLAAVLDEKDFLNPVNRSIFRYILSTMSRPTETGTAEVVGMFDALPEQTFANSLLKAFQPFDGDQDACDDMLFHSTRRLLIRRKNRQLSEACRAAREAATSEEREGARSKVATLNEELRQLKKMHGSSSRN